MIEVIVLGLILSADSFSAALAMGSRPFSRKEALRFAFSSGGAEALVTLLGFIAGSQIIAYIADFDHWIAFGLLAAVAIHMAHEGISALRSPEASEEATEFHSFTKVLIVSFATSLDALGVGISLGIANKSIGYYVVSIGVFAFVTTLIGLYLARRLSDKMGPVFTLVGSVILGAMSIQMLSI
ncbi:MAG: hypothetical protein OM95_13415 [Bdellovibrio sp. ArHS]|nr:MAG: hypothetical protein OM95_13415 [Bdellovibrio sp. ArHS]